MHDRISRSHAELQLCVATASSCGLGYIYPIARPFGGCFELSEGIGLCSAHFLVLNPPKCSKED
jgi:hypothetical protein